MSAHNSWQSNEIDERATSIYGDETEEEDTMNNLSMFTQLQNGSIRIHSSLGSLMLCQAALREMVYSHSISFLYSVIGQINER